MAGLVVVEVEVELELLVEAGESAVQEYASFNGGNCMKATVQFQVLWPGTADQLKTCVEGHLGVEGVQVTLEPEDDEPEEPITKNEHIGGKFA
jgi:hypothetical protein